MTALTTTLPTGTGQKHLILLGAGRSHLDVLAQWAVHPMAGVQVTLIAPHPRQLHHAMLSGFVAGHFTLDECQMALEPLIHNSGIRWLGRHAVGLDAQARTVLLDDGSKLPYDWLSINTGLTQDRSRIDAALPGAREYGLFVRPLETFATLWPRVTELPDDAARSVAVIGGDTTSIELAMAIRHRLPVAAVTLVTGGEPVAAHCSPAMQRRVTGALKKRRITVLVDKAVGLQRGQALLGCGAQLACDVPVLVTGAQAPAWLATSGLALDEQGLIVVDACQRASNHANVFAAARVATSSIDAALAPNLAAAMAGLEPRVYLARADSVQLLSCADRSAIASWRGLSVQGRWVGLLKDWVDQRFIRAHTKPAV